MKTKRIELEGDAGTVTIERDRRDPQRGSTIRIDSILREPKRGAQVWKTWEIDARIIKEELFKIAWAIQRRTDGRPGTNSDIHDYLRDLERFTD